MRGRTSRHVKSFGLMVLYYAAHLVQLNFALVALVDNIRHVSSRAKSANASLGRV